MPTSQKVIAIVAGDDSYIRLRVDWIIPQTASDAVWEAKANEIAAKMPHQPLNLVFTGGHGDYTATGEPRLLNNELTAVIRRKVQILKDKGLKFKSIVLNPCCSAAFIPLFQDLLTEDGVIFCQLASSVRNANAIIDLADVVDGNVFAAFFAQVAKLQCALSEIRPGTNPFPSDAVYTHRNRRLNRLYVQSITHSLKDLNDLAAGPGEAPDRVSDIVATINKLQAQGIETRDYHMHVDALELSVRALCTPPEISPLVKRDFSAVLELEPQIFPDERPYTDDDLNRFYSPKYSFKAQYSDSDSRTEIAGYIFANLSADGSIFIGNLGVNPSYQRAGIGARLLKQVIDVADREHKEVRLQVRSQNAIALKLYRSLGFQVTSNDGTWAQMKRPPQHPAAHDTNDVRARSAQNMLPSTPLPLNPVPPIKKNLSWSFILKATASVTFGAGLIALACVMLPPLGLVSLSLVTGYVLSSVGFAGGASVFGFFGYEVSKKLKSQEAVSRLANV